jgi:hypothetical protein
MAPRKQKGWDRAFRAGGMCRREADRDPHLLERRVRLRASRSLHYISASEVS